MEAARVIKKIRDAEDTVAGVEDPGAPSYDFASGYKLAMDLVRSLDPMSVACLELEQLYARLVGDEEGIPPAKSLTTQLEGEDH